MAKRNRRKKNKGPLEIAPLDGKGNRMEWNEQTGQYESKITNQYYNMEQKCIMKIWAPPVAIDIASWYTMPYDEFFEKLNAGKFDRYSRKRVRKCEDFDEDQKEMVLERLDEIRGRKDNSFVTSSYDACEAEEDYCAADQRRRQKEEEEDDKMLLGYLLLTADEENEKNRK